MKTLDRALGWGIPWIGLCIVVVQTWDKPALVIALGFVAACWRLIRWYRKDAA